MNARPFPIRVGRQWRWDVLIVATGELMGIRFGSYTAAIKLVQP
jgi:hypothetical protein